ncbi:MAG: FimV/HubP family polar landmark protein [Burkholderiaceae bacterium]
MGTAAHALALGKVTVLSALGEPLQAEIEIPEITAEEASSLRAGPATPEAFKAAGLDYNVVVSSLRVTLQKRGDGRPYLRISSERVINDPFVDLILEANWSSGRIVRDYTLLFDPPTLRAQTPSAPSAPQISPQATARPAPPPAPPVVRPTPPPVASPAIAAPAAKPEAPRKPFTALPKPQSSNDGKQVTVASGDTAAKIALAVKPASLSLDQMLIALLRSNPDAFVAGNVNRLRAGAVLDIPGTETVASVPVSEARQSILAQSKDFNEFRRKLAEGAPAAQVAAADRKSSGLVTAQVQEKKPPPVSPDKLTLSKGTAQSQSNEEQLAKARQAKEAASRATELSKNIKDLSTISAAASKAATLTATSSATPAAAKASVGIAVVAAPPVVAAPAASVASKAAAAVSTAATLATAAVPSTPVKSATLSTTASAAVPVQASASSAASAASAVAAASAVTTASATSTLAAAAIPSASSAVSAPAPAVAKPAKVPVPPPPPPETSLLDDLLREPLALLGLLIPIGLAGFLFYRSRKKKNDSPVDSSFLESRLQPDSFFGASGGQRVDTNESSATGSSMVYSPSQLDAAGDVDPVAEADVYLAYGRDLQAEEILKEALRTNPSRVAIHGKLLQIYAKRGDLKAFGQYAGEAYKLTRGRGQEWVQISALGIELDPANPMYQSDGGPVDGAASDFAPPEPAATQNFSASTTPQPIEPAYAPPAANVDLDLDLDFSLGDDEPAPVPAVNHQATTPIHLATAVLEPTMSMKAQQPSMDIDFGNATVALKSPVVAAAPVQLSVPDIAMSENSLTFTPEPPPPAPAKAAVAPAPANNDFGMMEFDLESLSLDLGSEPDGAAAQGSTASNPIDENDPLATKLALAEEFSAIGDPDGARTLAEEVVAEASGALKEKAKRLLAQIS